ncbi:MAG: hypothetical protein M3R27_02720 [Bacteroidota bacterium]|nr:hypothetical protein [Bacteroidota bacterium]
MSGRAFSQDVAIGSWKDHLSYTSALAVAEGDNKVFCVTRGGVFVLNKNDNSLERLSKVNSLSDVEATNVNFNPYNNKVVIVYKNSNVDLLQNGQIINLPDIKNKPILGNKSINNIYFINQYAYLSCGFGIVVIDTDRNEVKDTYYIGPGGISLNVRDITSDAANLYAATDAGIYKASLSNPNLANFSAWSTMTTGLPLPSGIYNTITAFNGKIYTNLSRAIMIGAFQQDTIYEYNGTSWSPFTVLPFGYNVYQLESYGNRMILVEEGRVWLYDISFAVLGVTYTYFGGGVAANQATVDNSNIVWIADNYHGLVRSQASFTNTSHTPNGPATSTAINMDLKDNKLWIAAGGVNNGYGNLFNITPASNYIDGEWRSARGNYSSTVNLDTLFDIMNVFVDPNDANKVYATTWYDGMLEFNNGVPVKLYNESNSSLKKITAATSVFNPIQTYGMAMDENNNLWVTNAGTKYSLSVKRSGGSWGNFDLSFAIGIAPTPTHIIVDENDQKWVVLARGGGLMVFKGNSTSVPNSSNTKKLTSATGNGKLPSNGVYSIAKDMDGEIWIGTDKGIAVFYSPESVFTGDNFDAQQILLEQDGHVQILLETELIQAIAVDDANRKWIATANSGVYLMSPDGTQQIYHFDESNSPLFDNDVRAITINRKTGEVYFATSKGVISYRGTSIEGNENFTDVYAFPNPVAHDYEGPIAIKGLVNNTILKVTDISGSLVYETKSEGGQALWDGKNFNGERVSTGVYMVFCTNEDGSQKFATKILVIN